MQAHAVPQHVVNNLPQQPPLPTIHYNFSCPSVSPIFPAQRQFPLCASPSQSSSPPALPFTSFISHHPLRAHDRAATAGTYLLANPPRQNGILSMVAARYTARAEGTKKKQSRFLSRLCLPCRLLLMGVQPLAFPSNDRQQFDGEGHSIPSLSVSV